MTMLMDFDVETTPRRPPRPQPTVPVDVPVDTTATVVQTVDVTHGANTHHTYKLVADEKWGWEELRDYVVDQVEHHHGLFPRDARKEHGIFKRFVGTWGADSAAIARYAFEVCSGRWAGAPISIERFCKGSDPFFAQPIIERIHPVA